MDVCHHNNIIAFNRTGDVMQSVRTRRLVLKNLEMKDAYWLYSYRALSCVEKYQAWKDYSYDDAVTLILQTAHQNFSGKPGIYQWGIYLDERLIGDLYWQLENDGICWIGYTLDPHYWHQGYALEAVAAWMKYLHHVFGIQNMMARILPENEASIQLVRKLGFRQLYPEIYVKNNW